MRSQPPNIDSKSSTAASEVNRLQQTTDATPFPFLNLPEDMQIEIATYATLTMVSRLIRASSAMEQLFSTNKAWKRIVARHLTLEPHINNEESLNQIIESSGSYRAASHYVFEVANAFTKQVNPQAPAQPQSLASGRVFAYWATLPFIKHVRAVLPQDHLLYSRVLPFFKIDDLVVMAQKEIPVYSPELIKRIVLLRYAQVADESSFKKILEKIPVTEQQTCLLELLLMSLSTDDFQIPASTFRRKNALCLLLAFIGQETRDQLITELHVLTERMFQQNRDIRLQELPMLTPFLKSVNSGKWACFLNIPAVWFFIQLCQKQNVPAFDFDLQELASFYVDNVSAKAGLILMAGVNHPFVGNMLQNQEVVKSTFRLMLIDNRPWSEIKSILTFISDKEKYLNVFLENFFERIFSLQNIKSDLTNVLAVAPYIKKLKKCLLISESFREDFKKTSVFDRVNNLHFLGSRQYKGVTVKGFFEKFPVVRAYYVEVLRERLENALREALQNDNYAGVEEIQKYSLECMKEVTAILIPRLVEALAKEEMIEKVNRILSAYFNWIDSGKEHADYSDYILFFFKKIFAMFINLDLSPEKSLLQALCRHEQSCSMLASYLFFLSDTNDTLNNLNNSEIKRVFSLLNESSCVGLVFAFKRFSFGNYKRYVKKSTSRSNRVVIGNRLFTFEDGWGMEYETKEKILLCYVLNGLLDLFENVVVGNKCQALWRNLNRDIGRKKMDRWARMTGTVATNQALPDPRGIDFTQWRTYLPMVDFTADDFTGAILISPSEFNDLHKLEAALSLMRQMENRLTCPIDYEDIDPKLLPLGKLSELKETLSLMRNKLKSTRYELVLENILSYCEELKINKKYRQALDILKFCFEDPIFSEHKTPNGETFCKAVNAVSLGLFTRSNVTTTTRQRRLLALIEDIEQAQKQDAELSRAGSAELSRTQAKK